MLVRGRWPSGDGGDDCIHLRCTSTPSSYYYLSLVSYLQNLLATMMLSTVTDCSRAVHPFAPASTSARGRSGSFLRFGAPRFNEDFIRVHRCDDHGVTHDLSLYYRIYHPSLMNSQESPPLIVLHGGP